MTIDTNSISNSSILVNVSAQGGLFKLKIPQEQQSGGGKRGKVKQDGISSASRKRMIETFASLSLDYTKPPVFITLTYPDDSVPLGKEYAHLKAFNERMRRRFPAGSSMWRKESEKRKSGKFKGLKIPHFHIIAMNVDGLNYKTIKKWWREIIGTDSKYLQVKFEICQNRRKAFAYVSKYVAKMTSDNVPRGDFSSEHGTDGAGQSEATLTISHIGTLGRWWGIFNRDYLPLGPVVENVIEISAEVFFDFRRSARNIFENIGTRLTEVSDGKFARKQVTDSGFTLFCNNAYQWMSLLGVYHQTYANSA